MFTSTLHGSSGIRLAVDQQAFNKLCSGYKAFLRHVPKHEQMSRAQTRVPFLVRFAVLAEKFYTSRLIELRLKYEGRLTHNSNISPSFIAPRLHRACQIA